MNVTAWPATTSADASAMAGHARPASSPSRRSRAAARRSRAHRDRPAGGRRRSASTAPATRSATAASGAIAPHGRRHDEEHGDGEDDLHDLPGRALPRHGAQPAVRDPAVDVADHPAGQGEVEEERAVVRGHRGARRQVDAQAAGDDPPAPGAADGGQRADARRGGQRLGVDRPQAVEERAGPQAPHQDGERRGGGQAAPLHGSTSRSACSTVTASSPAAACARRRSR